MGLPLATESSGVGVRKRGAEGSTEMKEEEPARQRSRLEHVGKTESPSSTSAKCSLEQEW